MFPHLERSLNILRPWMVTIDTNASNQSYNLNLGQTEHLLIFSSSTERSMASLTMNRNEFDVAEEHCHRCLANVRRLRI